MIDLRDFFLDNYSSLLIGHLIHGIVHNINGPLQALTMQSDMNKIEYERYIANSTALDEKFKERYKKKLENFDSEIAKLKDIAIILANKKGENIKKPLLLREIIDNEIKFWKGDLFFKHQIKTSVELPEKDVYLIIEEASFLKLLDAIFFIQIENLKKAKNEGITDLKLLIRLNEDQEKRERVLSIANNCVELKWLDLTDFVSLESLSYYVIREVMSRINMNVELSGTEFRISFPWK